MRRRSDRIDTVSGAMFIDFRIGKKVNMDGRKHKLSLEVKQVP